LCVKIPGVRQAERLCRYLVVSGLLGGPAATCLASVAPVGFTSPAAGARLEGGQTTGVEWVSDDRSVTAFDESELLLSLDGGVTFPLRVTRQIAPETHRLAWRVPAFPTRNARLALRTGSGSTPGSESIRFVSAEFIIEPAPQAPLEGTFLVAGEWRTRDALERPDVAPTDTGSFHGTEEDRIVPAAAQSAMAEPRPDPVSMPPASPLLSAPERPQTAFALFPSPRWPRSETSLPKRE
jgi:hypothetical protein